MSGCSYQPATRQPRLPIQVAGQIQDLIRARELRPGDRLPVERELCRKFEVSRTVVREALSILRAKGLLSSQGRAGTFVQAVEGDLLVDSIGMYISTQSGSVSLEHLMEVRRVIEVQTARLAAERATPEGIARLEEFMEAGRAASDADGFAAADLEFHRTLAQLSQNPLLAIVLEPFADALYEGRRLACRVPGVVQEALALHQHILDGIKAGDPSAAGRWMLRHLEQSRRVQLEGIRKQQKEP